MQPMRCIPGIYYAGNVCGWGTGRPGILRCYHISLTGFKEALFTPADTCNRVEANWADGGKILQPAEPPALAARAAPQLLHCIKIQ